MKMNKKILLVAALLALTFCLVPMTGIVAASEAPSGTVAITSKSIAIGVGISWGEGVLTFQGKKYPFKMKGLSVVDLGISSLSVAGDVYGLKKLEDFEGKYLSGKAGVAVGGGAEVTHMKNQNDVVMKVKATQQGVKLTLAPEGVSIEFKK